MPSLTEFDPDIADAIRGEIDRETQTLEMIASENFVSPQVLEALGSVMTNKYAEGYPGKRYYGGCKFVDVAESLAIERAKELFGAEHANVQPHSGSQANMAVYHAVCKPGDTILMGSESAGVPSYVHDAAAARLVRYGLHQQDEALVTCIVPSVMRDDHVHFVDGAAGGYTQAALQMSAGMTSAVA